MATNEGFDEDPLSCGGYSQLMDSDIGESFIYSPPPPNFHSTKPPTMLCFGNVNKEERGFFEGGKVTQKSGITGSDSSSASSSNNSSSSNSFTKSKRGQIEEPKKTEQEEIRNGLGSKPNQVPLSASGTISGSRRTCNKKPKKENPTSSGPVKKQVRKEKLGERITALQQLVSPFGKTDTASVLHEAMGYIRFLHDQVQVLSSPYLQKRPSSFHLPEDGRRRGEEEEEEEGNESSDLRSRGLCLVPVEYTVHVANCNGADLWSPAAMGISNSS